MNVRRLHRQTASGDRTARLLLRCTPGLLDSVNTWAKNLDMTQGAFVEQALGELLHKLENPHTADKPATPPRHNVVSDLAREYDQDLRSRR
jgi:hypothetical protein